MKEKHIGRVESKEILYEELEGFAREKIRESSARFAGAGSERMAGAREERA